MKRVWFLCPTVALAAQQEYVLRRDIPAASTRMLCGKDGMHAWTTQQHWDQALDGFDIVVATPAVLSDALVHGFVKLRFISLLVFDEAHHVANKHPAMRIMDNYHDLENHHTSRPKVLGLTASPVVRKGQAETALSQLERNLDAVVRTPKLYREQLLQYVHRPAMSTVGHDPCDEACPGLFNQLQEICQCMNFEDDPYIQAVKLQDQDQYIKAVRKGKSHTKDTIKKLLRTSKDVHDELGPSLCHIYIWTIATLLCERSDAADSMMPDMSTDEKSYLASLLRPLAVQGSRPSQMCFSPKLRDLIELLDQEMRSGARCILFVKTRAAVYLLHKFIEEYAPTNRSLQSGTLVGTSVSSNRGNNIELLDPRQQQSSLRDLASGEKNLLICTSVAEEGIDIAACNLVICFEPPPNLKSFVQRRGRARMSESKYILFLERTQQGALTVWKDLEEKMTEAYMNEMRDFERMKALEDEDEDGKDMVFRNEETGARLSIGDAVSHLYHFCNKLPGASHSIPMFQMQSQTHLGQTFHSCEVSLPASVDSSLRTCSSKRLWRSERRAKEEAAFQTLVMLFEAGLLNGHFLPSPVLSAETDDLYNTVAKRPNFATVAPQYDPWHEAAQSWATTVPRYQYNLTLHSAHHELSVTIISALRLQSVSPFSLYFDASTKYSAVIVQEEEISLEKDYIELCNQVTRLLLSSVFAGRMPLDKLGFPLLFVPAGTPDLHHWLARMNGSIPGNVILESSTGLGIVRDWGNHGKRYTFESLVAALFGGSLKDSTELRLKCSRLSKRADMLHPVPLNRAMPQEDNVTLLDPATCTVDRLPLEYAQFARMIPSIMHRIETQLIATKLYSTILQSVQLSREPMILPAISTPAAQEGADYERLELLGDTVLKVLTSLTLMAEHPNWHEGYLSHWKDRVVSNGRLATAAEQIGLTPFILTRPFTGAKWRPPYNVDLLTSESTKDATKAHRELSSKTLADVCEALIGIAFVDGHFEKAIRLLRVMLPEINWQPIPARAAILRSTAAIHSVPMNTQLQQVESLLDHNFNHTSLLVEAITHASHISTSSIRSYDRLEFLGDAILDYIVCTRLFRSEKTLSVARMHRLKTAAVNSGYLAYCALSTTVGVKINDIHTAETKDDLTGKRKSHTTFTGAERRISLPDFMRFTPDHTFSTSRRTTIERFQALAPQMKAALSPESKTYPWTLLAAFGPDKTFSDMIESVLAAVWIDTGCNFEACEKLVRRLGILEWLDDAIARDVHVWHPKEEVGAVVGKLYADKVTYDVSINDEHVPAGPDRQSGVNGAAWTGGKGAVNCKLLVGNRIIVETSGWNKIEAETRAAELGIEIMQAEMETSYSEVVPHTSLVVPEEAIDGGSLAATKDNEIANEAEDMPDADAKPHTLGTRIDCIAAALAADASISPLLKRKFDNE